MDDIWQCRHSREGCDSDEACDALDHDPQVTSLAQCIVDQEWDDYVNDVANVSPWNEGSE